MGLVAIALMHSFCFKRGDTLADFSLLALVGAGVATMYLLPWAMLPDTVEFSEWKTGLRREGILYAFFFSVWSALLPWPLFFRVDT